MAFVCYKEAAELGHPEGMDYISDCYGRGRGVKRDDDLSLYWKIRARAVRGDEAAKQWLKDRD